MSVLSDVLKTAAERLARRLAEDLLEGVAEIAGEIWRALTPEQVATIKLSLKRLAIAYATRGLAEEPKIQAEQDELIESAVNTVRAHLEAAGIVIRREAAEGIKKFALRAALGLIGI